MDTHHDFLGHTCPNGTREGPNAVAGPISVV